MEMKHLTAAELIKVTKDELAKTGFTNLTLKGIERVWINLEKYLHDKDNNHFSLDLGMAFLKERYQFTETPNLSSTNRHRLRAIQLLADFQTHQRILIRRKQKRYEFAQLFEKILLNSWTLGRAQEFQAEHFNRISSTHVSHPPNGVKSETVCVSALK